MSQQQDIQDDQDALHYPSRHPWRIVAHVKTDDLRVSFVPRPRVPALYIPHILPLLPPCRSECNVSPLLSHALDTGNAPTDVDAHDLPFHAPTTSKYSNARIRPRIRLGRRRRDADASCAPP
ncbi:hypothetical protein B0H10DRAFT_2436443 [Mycena sp. CBHHK59/15]|nr:hypothetical protein B0H10DRAFT_2436443 [Mycena sp. CBHHK59/15]